MSKKSKSLYKKKKNEKRKIKQEIRNSPKNLGSLEVLTTQWEKFKKNQQLDVQLEQKQKNKKILDESEQKQFKQNQPQKNKKIHNESKQKQFKQKEKNKEISNESEQKEIQELFDRNTVFRKQSLKVIHQKSGGSFGNSDFNSFASLGEGEKILLLYNSQRIKEDIGLLESSEFHALHTNELVSILGRIKNKENMREKLLQRINQTKNLDEKNLHLERKEKLDDETRKLKNEL